MVVYAAFRRFLLNIYETMGFYSPQGNIKEIYHVQAERSKTKNQV